MYIGSSNSISNRILKHFSGSPSLTIQKAILKYGPKSFDVYILEYLVSFERSYLYSREQFFLTLLGPAYNLNKILYLSSAPLSPKKVTPVDLFFNGILFFRAATLSEAALILNTSFFTLKKYYKSGTLLAGYITLKAVDLSINFVNPILTLEDLKAIRDTFSVNLKVSTHKTRGTKVYLYDLAGKLVNEFPSLTNLAIYLIVSRETLSQALNKGFIIKRAYVISKNASFPDVNSNSGTKTPKSCIICDLNGSFVHETTSIKGAAKWIGVVEGTVRERLNTGQHIIHKDLVYTKSF
jgi:hypothetical protein